MLAVKKQTVPRYKRSLEAKDKKIDVLLGKRNNFSAKSKLSIYDAQKIEDKLTNLSEVRDALKIRIIHYEAKILYWESYIQNASKRIVSCFEDVKKMKLRLKELTQEIKPNYKKLCDFYSIKCIEILKKV